MFVKQPVLEAPMGIQYCEFLQTLHFLRCMAHPNQSQTLQHLPVIYQKYLCELILCKLDQSSF